jgi:hypothetical protein
MFDMFTSREQEQREACVTGCGLRRELRTRLERQPLPACKPEKLVGLAVEIIGSPLSRQTGST